MFAVITPKEIQLSPGTVVRLPGTWQDYQILSQQLGDRSSPRIKYRSGEILLMAPLPEHGRKIGIIADVVKVLQGLSGAGIRGIYANYNESARVKRH